MEEEIIRHPSRKEILRMLDEGLESRIRSAMSFSVKKISELWQKVRNSLVVNSREEV